MQQLFWATKEFRTKDERGSIRSVFEDAGVAECYKFRPPYVPDLSQLLSEISGNHEIALDIGSGPGELAIPLADNFTRVTTIDRSASMLEAGIRSDAKRHPNINWIRGDAEYFDMESMYDLVTAGNSIHWMEHAVLFPKLAEGSELVAIVSGDSPARLPCGSNDWVEFVSKWLEKLENIDPVRWRRYDHSGFSCEGERHEHWMDIKGKKVFPYLFRQSVDHFIEGQHSQASWSRAAMGNRLSSEFDLELRELISPHQKNGLLELDMETVVTWGRARRTPR